MKGSISKAIMVIGSSLLALSVSTGAQAAQAAADAVLERACSGNKDKPIGEADLGEALLIQSDLSLRRFLASSAVPASDAPATLGATTDSALLGILREIRAHELNPESRGPHPRDPQGHIMGGILNLEQAINGPSELVQLDNGGRPVILFADSPPVWRLVCTTGKPSPGVIESFEARTPPPRIALREKPEELWLTGKEGRKAGAFQAAFERTRSVLEDGTRKTDTSFSIDGTAGYRLTPDRRTSGDVYLFATYALQRDRTRPKPQLGVGEKESDGDTNALNLGIDTKVRTYLSTSRQAAPGSPQRRRGWALDLDLQAGILLDFANDANRLRVKALALPRRDLDLLVCNLGSFKDGAGIRGRCGFGVEVEAAHVLRKGSTELGNYDNFLAAGGRASYELFVPSSGEDTGFLASATYRYLPVIHGKPDDIERLELALKHRFWTRFGAGIDVGFNYTKGTNELSLEQEDVLSFGFGIIY